MRCIQPRSLCSSQFVVYPALFRVKMGSIVDLNDEEIEELIILSIATNPWAQVVIFSWHPPGSSLTQN